MPLYRQIAQQIEDLILSEGLAAGTVLPSTRRLAETLGVGRKTVEEAYRTLRAGGLVSGHRRRGTVVLPLSAEHRAVAPGRPAAWSKLSSGRTVRLYYGPIHDQLFHSNPEGCIPLRHEAAMVGLVPTELALEAARRAVVEANQHGRLEAPLQGLPELQRGLVESLELQGLSLHRRQIVVVSGRQQGLFLAALALLRPGDHVALPVPCYSGHTQVFSSLGARTHEIPWDDQGPDLEHLEGVIQRYPVKLLVVSPTFRNPTGETITLTRRQELAKLASTHRVVLLEDDAYRALRLEGRSLPPLCSIDGLQRSIYLSTLEYELPLGLHLAFLAVPERMLKLLQPLKMAIEKGAPAFTQSVASYMLSRRRDVLSHLLPKLRERRDVLSDALEKACLPWMRWTTPEGGAFIWATLRDDLDALEVSVRALPNGVSIIPGEVFYPNRRGGERNLRLDFIGLPPDQLREGIRRLAETLRDLCPTAGPEAAHPPGSL